MSRLSKDLTSITDLDPEDVRRLLELAVEFKSNRGLFNDALYERTMVLVFEKPSLRTRVTFETAIYQMGGYCIYLAPGDIGLGTRESVPDTARNLSRWVDVIVARTFSHDTITGLARHATIPVINALSDDEHPCQALADCLTLYERWKDLSEVRLAYVGDGNNVCNSLLLLCAMMGTFMAVATPPGYGPPESFVKRAQELCARSGGEFLITTNPVEAVKGSHAVYTDVWASMGREQEAEQRRKLFMDYQVNACLMRQARPDALFLHCLPAHREEEVTSEVMDGPQSVVFDQAENRLHMQKAILHELLVGNKK
jgi:ornithine carbamoyltransferase